MPTCPTCGAELISPYRFCGRCGAVVPAVPGYAPYPAAVPAKKDNTAMIIAIVLVVVVVATVGTSAILYVMVSGLIGPTPVTTRPVMTLSLSTSSSLDATVVVTGMVPTVSPSNLKTNVQVGTAFGTAVSLPTVSGGTATIVVGSVGSFQLTWQDAGGDALVSAGDTFHLTNPAPLAAGTTVALIFIWTDGGTVSTITWQV